MQLDQLVFLLDYLEIVRLDIIFRDLRFANRIICSTSTSGVGPVARDYEKHPSSQPNPYRAKLRVKESEKHTKETL